VVSETFEAECRKGLRLIVRQTKGARTFMPTVSNGRRQLSGDAEGASGSKRHPLRDGQSLEKIIYLSIMSRLREASLMKSNVTTASRQDDLHLGDLLLL
jgi:hypothetical protein